MAGKPLPDQKLLLKLLRYDPDNGALHWRARTPEMFRAARNKSADAVCFTWNVKHAGTLALNGIDAEGYRRGGIAGSLYLAHRIIWKMVTGVDPDFIDHISGCRSENRWSNLRSVSRTDNNRNTARGKSNSSGCSGVSWNREEGKWVARITLGERRAFLGYFTDKGEAIRVRKAAKRQRGFHPNHGRKAVR